MKTRILSSLHRAALLLAAFAFATAARAGTFSTAAWTNDASTGIASGQTVWAYHFGSTTTATVNGISVPGLPGPTASNANFDRSQSIASVLSLLPTFRRFTWTQRR